MLELFAHTAEAFQVEPLDLTQFATEELLFKFAAFTKQLADAVLQQDGHRQQQIQQRLHHQAFLMGQEIKRQLHVRTPDEVRFASRLIYQILGIDFHGEPNGAITIKRCYFSRFYSAATCQLISALDEGLADGLAGGAQLKFQHRITEGKDCCRATLTFREDWHEASNSRW